MPNTTPIAPSFASIDPNLLMQVNGGRRCCWKPKQQNAVAPPPPAAQPPVLPTATPPMPTQDAATDPTASTGQTGDIVMTNVTINGKPVATA
jgi:hypothetical protein